MGLSNQQIERYARQIIVPGVSGIAQERLLSARLMVAGERAEVAAVLAYMVGAGVGQIQLRLPANDASEQNPMIKRAAQLNPDVIIGAKDADNTGLDLIVAISGDSATSEFILSSPGLAGADIPLILVHPEEPVSVAIFTRRPPCPLCADADLFLPSRGHADYAGFVMMVAAMEAFKLLANLTPPPFPTLLQFNGLACTMRQLAQRPMSTKCSCSKRVQAG